MTYFGFLAIFLAIPLIALIGLTWRDRRRSRVLPPELSNWAPQTALAGHVIAAVLYTTPWDNYLVASRVWWYDPNLVTGILLGWVPLEEYVFFVVQTLFAGLWLLYLARRIAAPGRRPPANLQLCRQTSLVAILIWLGAVGIFWLDWQPGTYLALELGWALIPITIQLAFGADIIWHYRRVVFLTLLPVTLYLSLADAIAIGSGTWTINPTMSLELYLGGVLPLEEFIFFLLTNTLVTFGMVLVMARHSQARLDELLKQGSLWLRPSRREPG